MRRRLMIFVLVACGGRPTPTAPQPDLDNMRMYEPLAMRSEAKLPDHAVILGTDDKGGSTVLRIPATSSATTVDTASAEALRSVRLTTAPNADGNVHVGTVEERVGIGTSQWRASVWVAAIVAAHTLGKDLTDFTFSASAADAIDGPSASGLIAGGFLASITGAKIRGDVTAIGVINPDGTIGPAQGIVEKLGAAIANGKKTVGIPSGMRRVKASNGSEVDVVELAKRKGAIAVELRNVHDVYKLLTGTALPMTVPVGAVAMAVEPDRAKAVEQAYDSWQTKLAARAAGLAELQRAKGVPPPLVALAGVARQYAERAAALRAKGLGGAAFARVAAAWAYAAAATDAYAILVKVRAGDLAGAAAVLDVAALESTDALDRIAAMRPNTVGGHLLMMAAYQSALRGSGFASMAQTYVANAKGYLSSLDGKSRTDLESPAVTEGLIAIVVPTQLLIAGSLLESAIATQRLEFETAKSIVYMCSLPNVIRLATSYRSASAAGMAYVDSLIVEPLAKAGSITVDEARQRVAASDPNYLLAFALAHLDQIGESIKQTLGEKSLAWNLMLLAGAERAYLEAAQLTAKHYSLAEASDGALDSLLVQAESAARANARAAQVATGAIPIQAKFAYQHATVQREGDRAEKIDALSSYWSASAYSQAAVMLARN